MKSFLRSILSFFIIIIAAPSYVGLHSILYAEAAPAEPAITTSTAAPKQAEEITDAEKQLSLSVLQDLAAKDPRAAYDLSLRYFRGDGVPQNSYQAIQTMRDAAERDLLEAQKALGRLYLTGLEEMGSDLNEAHKWLSIAAGKGDKEASDLLKQVISARQNEREWSIYRKRLHPYTYRYWYHDSLYKLYWRHGHWRYY